ncbi:MAG: sensor histidine kinase [Myxococcota bacterium]
MLQISFSIALVASAPSVTGAEVQSDNHLEKVYERVAELTGEDPAEGLKQAEAELRSLRSTLWLGRFESLAAIALIGLGDMEAARPRFEKAAEWFREGRHMPQLAKMQANLGFMGIKKHDFADGIPRLVEAERIFAAEGVHHARAKIQFVLAEAHVGSASADSGLEAARAHLHRGLDALGPEDPRIAQGQVRLGTLPENPNEREKWRRLEANLDARSLAYYLLASIAFVRDDTKTALRWSESLVQIAEAQGRPREQLSAKNLLGSVLILDGQIGRGVALFDSTLDELDRRGLLVALEELPVLGAKAHLKAGRLERAEELALSVFPAVEGSNSARRLAHQVLLTIYKQRGDSAKALAQSEALNELSRTINSANGQLLQASYATQQRFERAELNAQTRRAVLIAAALGLLLLLGSCIVLLRGWTRSVRDAEASKTVSALQRTLNRELRHRFGNQLATLRAAVERSRGDDPTDRLDRIRQSIEAMSALDAVISEQDDHPDGIDLGLYLETLLSLTEEIYAPRVDLRWDVEAEGVRLEPKRVFLVGLAVAETVHNALEHGFAGLDSGSVRVSVRREGADAVVSTEDDGQGFRQPAQGPHQGLSILRDMSAYLDGSIQLEPARPGALRPGARVSLRLPIKAEEPRLSLVTSDSAH